MADIIEIKFRGKFEGKDDIINSINDVVSDINKIIQSGLNKVSNLSQNISKTIKKPLISLADEYKVLDNMLNNLGNTSVESAVKVRILQRQLEILKETTKQSSDSSNTLKVDIDNLNKAYLEKSKLLKEALKTVNEAESILRKYGMRMRQLIQWQLEWYAGAGLIWGAFFKIRDAISEFIDYSQGLTDVGAITMATAEQLKEMDKVARQVATSSTMGFKAGAEALKIMGQAGMSASDSMKSLSTVAMLTTATGAATNDIVKLLTTSMNVWNLSADKSANVGNALAAALNYSKLEIGDLTVAFNYLAAQSKLMGYSLESTLAIVAQLAQMGVKASTIGTGLSQFMGSLLAPTKRFKDALDKVGLSIKDLRDSSGNILPFVEVIRKLEKAGMDVATVFEGLEKREARNLANALASGADSFKNMEDAITGTNAMFVMFNKSMDGVKNRLIVLKNHILDLAFSIVGVLTPAIKGVVSGMTNFIIGLKEVGPMLLVIAGAFTGWKILAPIIAVINSELGIMATILNLIKAHPFLLIATAVIALVSAIGYLKQKLDGIKQAQDSYNKSMENSMQIYQNVADINRYIGLLKNENVSYETKDGLLRKLRELMPDIIDQHANLSDVIRDLKDENSKLNGAIAERIRLFQMESIEAQIPGIQAAIDQYHKLYLAQKYFLDLQRTKPQQITNVDAFNQGLKKANDNLQKIQPQIDQIINSISKAKGDALVTYMGGLRIPQEMLDMVNLQADLARMEKEKERTPIKSVDNEALKERVNLADLEAKLAEKRFQGVEKQLRAENDINNELEAQLGVGLRLLQIEEYKRRTKILLSKETEKIKDAELELLDADIENKRQALYDKYISAKSKSIDKQAKDEIGNIKDKERAEERAYNRSLKLLDLTIDEQSKLDDMVAVELLYKEKVKRIDEETARKIERRKGTYEEEKIGIEKKLSALEQTEGLFRSEQKDKLLDELKEKEKDYNDDILVLKQKGADDIELIESANAAKLLAIKERLINEKVTLEKRLSKSLKTERELDLQVAEDIYSRDLELLDKLFKNELILEEDYFKLKRILLIEYERASAQTAYKDREYYRKINQQKMQDATTFEEYVKARMESLVISTYDLWEEIGNVTTETFRNLETTIGSIFFDGMKGQIDDLSSYFQKFADYVLKLLSDLAAKALLSWIIKTTGLGSLFGFAGGGEVGKTIEPYTEGLAGGGFIQGAGGTKEDKVLARLSNKEYVVNAESTSQFKPLLDAINFGTQGIRDRLKGFLSLMSGSADFKIPRATDFEFAGAGNGVNSLSIYVPIRADMSNKAKSGLRGDMEAEMEKTALKVIRKYL